MKIYVDYCKDAQEILGKVNDTSTTVQLLECLAANADVLHWAQRQETKAADHVGETVVMFRAAKLFWDQRAGGASACTCAHHGLLL